MTEPDFSLVVLCYRSGQAIVPFVEKLCRRKKLPPKNERRDRPELKP
ncbi:MAG TPA: hypothetical protein VGC87_03560 [Pyrinomonadaceae bacterium]